MQLNGKTVCVCDCEGSMPLAVGQIAKACGGEATEVATHLCRAQLGRFEETLKAADGDIVVACTQEAPLFLETADDLGFEGDLSFANIREKAGWSSEGDGATPKVLALLAEATLPRPITGTVELESGGSVLVIGSDDKAWVAAETLANTLNVTLLLKPDGDFTPPAVSRFPVFSGTARSATGHLGAFTVILADVAAYTPSSRQRLKFEPAGDGGEFEFDLILDLGGGAPLVTSPEKRDGYFNPEPGNPAAVMTALFELAGLTGTFEKPQYVSYDPDICAHARSGIVGCTKCIDACPAGAVSSAGEKVAYDASICAGCGNCAGVCPTGAARYLMPSVDHLLTRLRALAATYRDAGGTGPRPLVHDGDFGEDLISTLARFGDGLPASMIPFAVNSVAQAGLEFLLSAVAYGYGRIALLVPPEKRDELDSVHGNVDLAKTILVGLGYGNTRLEVISERDPSAVGSLLADGGDIDTIEAATFLSTGGKRSLVSLALGHLHGQAPEPVDVLALPEGAPFGTVDVDVAGCTLCLSCVGACPAGALADNPDMPQAPVPGGGLHPMRPVQVHLPRKRHLARAASGFHRRRPQPAHPQGRTALRMRAVRQTFRDGIDDQFHGREAERPSHVLGRGGAQPVAHVRGLPDHRHVGGRKRSHGRGCAAHAADDRRLPARARRGSPHGPRSRRSAAGGLIDDLRGGPPPAGFREGWSWRGL